MKPVWAVIPLSLALILLVIGVIAGPLWVASVTWPVRHQMTQAISSVAGFTHWFSDINQLTRDKDQLARERNQLLVKVTQLQAVSRQDAVLRQQLNLAPASIQHLVMAQTAGLVQQHDTAYLLLNKGSADSVKVGQLVTANGVLVGKVKQTSSHTSLVSLPQSVGNTIPVVIRHGEAVTKGIVEGSFNVTARLNQVLPTEELQTGDIIQTSPEGGSYPPDLVVGKVGTVTKVDQQVFQSADVALLWNLTNLEYVFVGL